MRFQVHRLVLGLLPFSGLTESLHIPCAGTFFLAIDQLIDRLISRLIFLRLVILLVGHESISQSVAL